MVASSDDFYGTAQVLNRPDQARNMGEGWETRRRRDGDHDWVLIRLGYAGTVSRLVFDTSYYRYNASEAVSVTGSATGDDTGDWAVLLARTELQPDTVHDLMAASRPRLSAFVRVDAYPDGGLSRIRVVGHVDPERPRRRGAPVVERPARAAGGAGAGGRRRRRRPTSPRWSADAR